MVDAVRFENGDVTSFGWFRKFAGTAVSAIRRFNTPAHPIAVPGRHCGSPDDVTPGHDSGGNEFSTV